MTERDIDKTVNDFVQAAKKHYAATMMGDPETTNRYARKLHGIFQKIVALGNDARDKLLAKTDDDDAAVAAMAAVYSLKYNTEKSLAALKRIASDPGIIGFEAQQAIKRWEEGAWQLEQ
jgi:hypothetical protein